MARNVILLIVCFLVSTNLIAGDTLQITLSKNAYQKGDSIELNLICKDYQSLKLKSASVHVWIDNVKTHQRWKFRYPLIEGELNAALKINETIEDGNYLITCMIQNGFYKIYGHINDLDQKDSIINYMMRTNKNKTLVDQIKIDKNKNFVSKPLLFEEKASFYFSPIKKTKNNYLSIQLTTPIDSFFNPIITNQVYFSIGKTFDTTGISKHHFTFENQDETFTLNNVTVYSKVKTKVQEFDDQYSSGLFKNENAIIFDGIENEELANSPTLGWFLQQKVPGLTVETDSANNEVFKWRQEICSIFIDEFELLPGEHTLVFPRDIAMIKVFRPPFQYSSTTGFSGAIAIYTKRGKYFNSITGRNGFVLNGYTPFDSEWK